MSKGAQSKFIYVTYIRTTMEELWSALTDEEFIKQYWFGMRCESEWKAGSPWKMVFDDGRIADTGEIVQSEPGKRLVIRWRNEFRPELTAEGHSQCAFELTPENGVTKLVVTHSMEREDSKFIEAVSGGWPKILSNLKSLLETGQAVMTSIHT